MRALIEALDPLGLCKSSVAHPAAIMAFELVTLSLSSADNASLYDDDDVVKWTIVTAISMATIYRS